MLGSAGLGGLGVEVVVAHDDVVRGKPDPEGFLKACSLLGVRPSEALVFEDSRPGIASARAAGIPVAFVREFSVEDNARLADRCFESLADAVPWVRQRIGWGRRRAP